MRTAIAWVLFIASSALSKTLILFNFFSISDSLFPLDSQSVTKSNSIFCFDTLGSKTEIIAPSSISWSHIYIAADSRESLVFFLNAQPKKAIFLSFTVLKRESIIFFVNLNLW